MKARSMFAVAVVALAVTGCTREIVVVQEPAPTTTVKQTTTTVEKTTTTTTTEYVSIDDQYLAAVKRETTLEQVATDMDLLNLGYMICTYLESGGDSAGLAEIIYTAGMSSGAGEAEMMQYARLAGIAAAWLCPEQGWRL